jgi:general secretion pathway protein D
MRIVLSKGDRVFEVREGETLEDGYRIESITPHAVTFSYLPLGVKEELQVAGTPLDLSPPARSAQLRFEGPEKVRTGKPFDVALKLTSPQPVRSLPMQLSFDAKRLEPLAVRAGDLFAGGSFSYRVNANGSIVVGASGSARAALDGNLLVVTFRPIAAGPAELKVSALELQGAAGRTIAHEPPQAFRAAIVQ